MSAPSKLGLARQNIPQQHQRLARKPYHVPPPLPFPLRHPRLHIPLPLPALPIHDSKRDVPGRPIPRIPTRRTRSPALAQRVRRPQRAADVPREARHQLGRGAAVGVNVRLRPAGVRDARFQGVERVAAAVEARGAGDGEEGGGDETARCLRAVSTFCRLVAGARSSRLGEALGDSYRFDYA